MSENKKTLWDSLLKDATKLEYFVSRYSEPDFFWFCLDNNLFKPREDLGVIKNENGYSYQRWLMSSYLEKISKREDLDGKIVESLLNIIKDFCLYRDKNNKPLYNMYIYWSFIKILSNLNLNKVMAYLKDGQVNIGEDWIKAWIITDYEKTLIDSEIGKLLLPKFLVANNAEATTIAEQIIDTVTSYSVIKKGEKVPGVADYEVRTYVEAHWLIDSVFSKDNCKAIANFCSEESIINIANKLRNILEYRCLSANLFKSDKLLINLKKRVDGDNILVGNYVLSINNLENNTNKETFICAESIAKLEEAVSDELRNYLGRQDSTDALRLMLWCFERDNSYIWAEYLGSTEHSRIEADINFKTILVSILEELVVLEPKKAKDIFKLLSSDIFYYPIFKRIILYFVNKYWEQFNSFFDVILENTNSILDDSHYEKEINDLYKNHKNSFTKKQKTTILKLIESPPLYYSTEEQEEWKRTQKERLLPSYIEKELKPRTQVRWGAGNSPISLDDFMRLSDDEIKTYLIEFTPERVDLDSPTLGGLADILSRAIKNEPEKFIALSNLILSEDIKNIYIYHYLNSFIEIVKDKDKSKKYDFDKLFFELNKFIKNKKAVDYEENRTASWDEDRYGFLTIVDVSSRLIKEIYSKNLKKVSGGDGHIKEILQLFLDNIKYEKQTIVSDYANYSLNTCFGRCLEAYINYSLITGSFNDEFKQAITKYLDGHRDEAYSMFGYYLIDFYNKDNLWVTEKLKYFENLSDDCWLSFIDAFSYVNLKGGFKIIYGLMKNHYNKYVEEVLVDTEKMLKINLLEKIVAAYLLGLESLEQDSLFYKLVSSNNSHIIQQINHSFSSYKEYVFKETNNIKEKEHNQKLIINVVNYTDFIGLNLTEIRNAMTHEEYAKTLSTLVHILPYLGKSIEDKHYNLYEAIASETSNDYFFVQHLNIFKTNEDVKKVSNLFVILMKKNLPEFQDKIILELVEKMYCVDDSTTKENANKVCLEYFRQQRGPFQELKRLHQKYNVMKK